MGYGLFGSGEPPPFGQAGPPLANQIGVAQPLHNFLLLLLFLFEIL
jgi:hypothetical protein